jgi:hypothetical protein
MDLVAACMYLGTMEGNENYILEEIKSMLCFGNACYHSVQNLLPPCLHSVNTVIKKYKISLPEKNIQVRDFYNVGCFHVRCIAV